MLRLTTDCYDAKKTKKSHLDEMIGCHPPASC